MFGDKMIMCQKCATRYNEDIFLACPLCGPRDINTMFLIPVDVWRYQRWLAQHCKNTELTRLN